VGSNSPGGALDVVDLWSPVSPEALPPDLIDAFEREDWPNLKKQLGVLLDGVVTDGVYGRAILQMALRLPIGINSVFDRYRAAASVDHGDWDALQRCLAAQPLAPIELLGLRDILLAPLTRSELPYSPEPHHVALFGAYEYQMEQELGRFRHWARNMLNFEANAIVWERPDIPAGRHIRNRRLQDAVFLAFAEAEAGDLRAAGALAIEGQRLGDAGEPLQIYAADLEVLTALAMGDDRLPRIRAVAHLQEPTGPSPLGAWQLLNHLMPLLPLADEEVFAGVARIGERIATRLGSPRAQLHSYAWRVASESLSKRSHPEIAGVRAQAHHAGRGLRVLPQLLYGRATERYQDFVEAERLARLSGNVWAQIVALTWMVGMNPTERSARWLARLLDATSWRRPVLVPAEVHGDAALGLISAGERGEHIVEFASAAGRPNILYEVSLRHVDDTAASLSARVAAVEALGTLGTTRSQETLLRLSRRVDELGRRARVVADRHRRSGSLTQREVEVMGLLREGLTNRAIAERLSLSPHTIARHLQNARAKLGASNRTEAATKLERILN
jgi:DNA-binding CsgD family transcriptional regulator